MIPDDVLIPVGNLLIGWRGWREGKEKVYTVYTPTARRSGPLKSIMNRQDATFLVMYRPNTDSLSSPRIPPPANAWSLSVVCAKASQLT